VDPKRERRFADTIARYYDMPLSELLEDVFPFGLLNPNSSIIDIRGGSGQNLICLATKFLSISFIL
jgi:hypothetical protein